MLCVQVGSAYMTVQYNKGSYPLGFSLLTPLRILMNRCLLPNFLLEGDDKIFPWLVAVMTSFFISYFIIHML